MKTEVIARPVPRDYTRSVSRALLEISPLSCEIVDRRGRQVPLSVAGYVLRGGETYSLHVRLPFQNEEIDKIRIDAPPEFVTVFAERLAVNRQGHGVRAISVQVKSEFSDLWGQLKKFGVDLRSGELSIVTDFKPSAQRECPSFSCPIVVRPRWSIVAAGALFGIAVAILEGIGKELFFTNDATLTEATSLFHRLFGRPVAWYLFLGVAGITALASYSINMVWLYLRGKELRSQFRDHYTVVDS